MMARKNLTITIALLTGISTAAVNAGVADNVTLSGLIETEYGTADYGGKESGIALATFALGIDAKINEIVDGHVIVLHEDSDTEPWEVDEGIITLHSKDNKFFFSAGRMYVPFGNFASNMVSDPLTHELGEIREAAMQFGMDMGGLTFSVFTFNGDTIKASDDAAGNDEADQYGFAVGYTFEKDKMTLDVGLSYLNNIADTDGFTGALETPVPNLDLVDYIAGNAVYVIFGFEPVTFIIEQVSASDKFDAAELAWQATGAEPASTNIELATTLQVSGKDITIAIGQQETEEAVAMGLPEKRTLIAVSTELLKNTSLAFEMLSDTDYSVADGGSGEKGDATTIQLAVEF